MTDAAGGARFASMAMRADDRIRELHARAVRELVGAHRKRNDEPLVLAVHFRRDDPVDVYLLEALQGFPGDDEDELLTTEFEPSAQLRILGKLHLALGSPGQIRTAAARNDATVAETRNGEVLFDDGSADAIALKKLLGL